MVRKNSVLAFLLSFIPGFGQIYMGYIPRGIGYLLSILVDIMLLILLILTDPSEVVGFALLIIAFVIWLIAFVDSMVLLDRMKRSDDELERNTQVTREVKTIKQWEEPQEDKQAVSRENRKLIAMLLSIIPGAGHMYLGLLIQGIQLMSIFMFCFYLNALLGDSLFMFFVPVIWFFGMFDTMKKASAEYVEDNDILFVTWIKNGTTGQMYKQKVLGYLMFLVGFVAIVNRIAAPIISKLLHDWNIRGYIQTGILAVIFIVGGMKLILSSSPSKYRHTHQAENVKYLPTNEEQ